MMPLQCPQLLAASGRSGSFEDGCWNSEGTVMVGIVLFIIDGIGRSSVKKKQKEKALPTVTVRKGLGLEEQQAHGTIMKDPTHPFAIRNERCNVLLVMLVRTPRHQKSRESRSSGDQHG